MSVVAKVSASPLAVSTVVELLKNPPKEAISSLPPVKPKAGEAYLFSPGGNVLKKGMYYLDMIDGALFEILK